MKLTSATSIFPCLKLVLQFIQWITNPIQNGFFSFVWFFKCDLVSLTSEGREDWLPYCNLLHRLRDYTKQQARIGIHPNCSRKQMCFHERGLSSWKKTRVWIALHPGVVNKPRLRLNRDQRGKALMSQARNSTTLRTRRKLLLQLKTQTHNFPLHLWTWRPPRVSAAYLSQVLFSRTPGPCLGLSLPRDAPARSPRCRTRVWKMILCARVTEDYLGSWLNPIPDQTAQLRTAGHFSVSKTVLGMPIK